MIFLRKKEITKNNISYYYKLGKKLKEGVLKYLPKEDVCRVESFAEEDEDENFEFYRTPAFCAIMRFYRNNDYPDEKTIMWY